MYPKPGQLICWKYRCTNVFQYNVFGSLTKTVVVLPFPNFVYRTKSTKTTPVDFFDQVDSGKILWIDASHLSKNKFAHSIFR